MSLENLVAKLESAAQSALDWFHSNRMKLNSSKCHLLVCRNKFECMLCEIGVNIESELTFKNHMGVVCRKASQKLNALSRLCSIIPFQKRRMLMQAFFISHFSYSPLVWMLHNRNINTRIKKLHFRALCMVYREEISMFEELLERDNSPRKFAILGHRNV